MNHLGSGERYIEITALGEKYKVWTRKFGDHPTIKILLLHGGPGGSYHTFECFKEHFMKQGYEFYYYDQLGSYLSDNPDNDELWTIDRFVDEVEQVRVALGLNQDNFYLCGNSWGGMLGLEYALKHQQHLKGLIISSAQASIPDYNRYANEVLAPQLDADVIAEIKEFEAKKDFSNPRYDELLKPYYKKFVIRLARDVWPQAIKDLLVNLNMHIYNYMNGPSEFGSCGTFKDWDVKGELHKIVKPTLIIGSTYNTMDPKQQEWMSNEVQNGQYLHCPSGGHMAMWDDPKHYFPGLIKYINELDSK